MVASVLLFYKHFLNQSFIVLFTFYAIAIKYMNVYKPYVLLRALLNFFLSQISKAINKPDCSRCACVCLLFVCVSVRV